MTWFQRAGAVAIAAGALAACAGEDAPSPARGETEPATAPGAVPGPGNGERTPFDVTRLVMEKKIEELTSARADLAAELEALRAEAPSATGGRYAEGVREEVGRLEERLAGLDAEIRRARLTLQNLPE